MTNRRYFLKKASLFGMASLAAPGLTKPGPREVPADIKIKDVKGLLFQDGYDRGVYVRIEATDGTVGWGESSANGIRAVQTIINDLLAREVVGKSPFDTEQLWENMFWKNVDLGSGGILTYAIAGVDCALWDLKAKLLGVPVYKMIGGKFRDSVPAYAGFGIKGGAIPVDEAVKQAVKLGEKGFKTVKIRAQIREYNINPKDDPSLKYYTAMRKELPDSVDLFLDPNEGYTGYRAIEIGKALQDMGMKYYESPCPNENLEDLATVVDALTIPVMAGEKCYTRWMVKDLIEKGKPDMINTDFIKSGGITEGLKICHIAGLHHKQVVPHNTKPMQGSAATMQLLASIPNCGPMVEYIEADRYATICSIFDQGIEFKEGNMMLPKENGLGLVINEKRAKALFKY
ncbi:galactonate dehydratase [Rhabdobacter roseus]|uniref:L-alanine-DL-glutamate epimerase-like enolase superfamily enzyme n=1 Tax=Rhabdobacter roseus TaxID=1655419 RepID=A0A840TLW6_9BACT|nr:mandelate racemase/muconate lactonizing enzyme family protein [Rhabdobacter roseus]MBB5284581.1 L-alanine-DL-glutamate epimerase-like enolase superfamily enzyme [Rhabdobacter roseus]